MIQVQKQMEDQHFLLTTKPNTLAVWADLLTTILPRVLQSHKPLGDETQQENLF